MLIRPAISFPLPWLTLLAGRFLGKGKHAPKAQRATSYIFPRSLKVTTLGKWYIAVLILIGIAAINTGNNLLYLVVGMLLSLIIISGLLSESTLRGLKTKRYLPAHIYKNRQTKVGLEVTKRGKILSLPPFSSYSFVLSEEPVEGLVARDTYVVKLDRNKTLTRECSYKFQKRGIVELKGIRTHTTFPFSFFKKGKRESIVEKILVYPEIKILDGEQIKIEGRSRGNDRAGSSRGDGLEDIYGLREYAYGDDARRIDWKSSARTKKLLFKEFEQEEARRVLIDFDNRSAAKIDESFEESVTEAASLAAHFSERGFYVGLKTNSSHIECAQGSEQLFKILTNLAMIGPGNPGEAVSQRPRVRVRSI